jgi:hypothetical protein
MAAMSSKVQVGCLPRKLVDFTNKDWFISKKDWTLPTKYQFSQQSMVLLPRDEEICGIWPPTIEMSKTTID